MTLRIETSNEKKLVGKQLIMNFENYTISELWRSFLPNRKKISNNLNDELISMAIYKPKHFEEFSTKNEFERWATVEVSDFENVPIEMKTFVLQSGLYAVFKYRGLNTDYTIFEYIMGTWLPNSEYELDNRPHFEILSNKYKNNDSTSEEEIWIPIKPKKHSL